jgi:hypothetical protein
VPLNYFKILSRHLFGGAEENYEIKIWTRNPLNTEASVRNTQLGLQLQAVSCSVRQQLKTLVHYGDCRPSHAYRFIRTVVFLQRLIMVAA